MKVFNNNDELMTLIKERNGIKYIDFEFENIMCYFDIVLPGVNIINVCDINARNINANNIDAWNINANNIDAWSIDANNIDANNINANNINANNINANNISYYAVCFAYKNIKCASIKGRRDNAKHFCLDGEITIQNSI